MSAKITEVRTESGAALADYGHLTHAEMTGRLRAYLQRQRDEAVAGLVDLAADRVRVFHQRGVYSVHDRREVQQ